MKALRKGPDGKFLPWGGEMAVWLPVLLRQGIGDQEKQALRIIAESIASKASVDLRHAAEWIVSGQLTEDHNRFARNATWIRSKLDYHEKRRAAILECIAKLEAE